MSLNASCWGFVPLRAWSLTECPQWRCGTGIVSGLSVCQSLSGRVASLISDGFIDGVAALDGRAVLTLRGRLLADYVTRELMGY